ncbi:hypothetical protein BH18CHL2_BH18CHL2_00650 [soil metagenome]
MLTEIAESQELYVVFIMVFLLLAAMYFLQKWWTTYR